MEKETIKSYLIGVKTFIEEGKFIRAYEELKIVIENLEEKHQI